MLATYQNQESIAPIINQAVNSPHISKVRGHSQTRLSPQTYLEINQTRSERIFTETNRLDRKSVIQKYFGKKVLYPERHSDIVRIISSRKFFHKVKFSEMKLRRNSVSFFKASDLKCLSNQIFLDNPIKVYEQESWKLISTATSNITLSLSQNSQSRSFKPIRFFSNNLRNLNLTVPTQGWPRGLADNSFGLEYLRIFEDLFPMTHLETFTLQFQNSLVYHDYTHDYTLRMRLFLRLLQKLVTMKSLRIVNINLFKMLISYQFLTELLLCLDASHIEKWHIIGYLKAEEMLDIKTIGPVLEKIDFLGLKFGYSQYQNPPDYLPIDLSKMPELTAKRKKILDLEAFGESWEDDSWEDDNSNTSLVRLSEILPYCKSLEGLYIKSLCYRLNWDMTASQMASLAHVKDLVLILYEFDLQCDDYFNNFLWEFMGQNSVLRSLQMFFCNDQPQYDGSVILKMPTFINPFASKELLEDVTLYSDGCHTIDEPGEIFISWTSLKRLTLHLCQSNEASSWENQFPFQDLSHLTEFRLIIHSNMKITPWEESFAGNIALLSNIQVLEIIDNTNTIMPLYALYGILKELCHIQNLRKIKLEANIERQVLKDTLFIVGEEWYNKCELKVIEDIKGKIMRIVSANPMLEELYIGKFEGYSISQISYKKFLNKQ